MLDYDQLTFAKGYIVKNLLVGSSIAEWTNKDFDNYIDNEMDKADYKRMMTAYRVAKKRKADKENGSDLVAITVTQESHAILKALANARGVTLSQVVERTGLKTDLMLTRDLERLSEENNYNKKQVEQLKFELSAAESNAKLRQEINPTQNWCFSPEELQEQARLIERLTKENARLKAELQLKDREIEKLTKAATGKNALVNKTFQFTWNNITRTIRRTAKAWVYKDDGTNGGFKDVGFIKDCQIRFNSQENSYFIELGEGEVFKLNEIEA